MSAGGKVLQLTSPSAAALKRRKRKPKPSAGAAPRPWECVLLTVDSGRVSGWAIGSRGFLLHSGQHNTELEPIRTRNVIKLAASCAAERGLPVVLVCEFRWGGKARTTAGLWVAVDRWRREWRALGQSDDRFGKCASPTWRSCALGPEWATAKREAVRPHERRVAQRIAGLRAIGADEAPAICMQVWGCRSAMVGELIGEEWRRRSEAKWTEPRR